MGHIAAVPAYDEYLSCSECCAKVVPKGNLGKCTKCPTMERLSSCSKAIAAKIRIESENGVSQKVSIFQQMIAALLKEDPASMSAPDIMDKLLLSPSVRFYINYKGVVCGIERGVSWRDDPKDVKRALNMTSEED